MFVARVSLKIANYIRQKDLAIYDGIAIEAAPYNDEFLEKIAHAGFDSTCMIDGKVRRYTLDPAKITQLSIEVKDRHTMRCIIVGQQASVVHTFQLQGDSLPLFFKATQYFETDDEWYSLEVKNTDLPTVDVEILRLSDGADMPSWIRLV